MLNNPKFIIAYRSITDYFYLYATRFANFIAFLNTSRCNESKTEKGFQIGEKLLKMPEK